MTLREELAEMTAAEEERLKVGGPDFRRRHEEIMSGIDRLMGKPAEPGAPGSGDSPGIKQLKNHTPQL